MREWVIESIILGSLAPGLTAFSLGFHLLGAVLVTALVIAALYTIGSPDKPQNRKHTT